MTLSPWYSEGTPEEAGEIGTVGTPEGWVVKALSIWGALETFCMKCQNNTEMPRENHRVNSGFQHRLWLINMPALVDHFSHSSRPVWDVDNEGGCVRDSWGISASISLLSAMVLELPGIPHHTPTRTHTNRRQ